ncbi:MAG: c-type cytochrome [Planctomycetes bacterium]|nr:c-type cytochrome [Planctomycetota bacterium]
MRSIIRNSITSHATPQPAPRRGLRAALAAALLLPALSAPLPGCGPESPSGAQGTGVAASSSGAPVKSQTVAEVYASQCAPCHGATGGGDGPAAYLLNPKPRNFQMGKFRLTSTVSNAPTDADLARAITRGVPGSAMPPFSHLSDETRAALAVMVRGFWQKALAATGEYSAADITEKTTAGPPLDAPAETPDTAESRATGARLFEVRCAECHGKTGHGDGKKDMKTSEGHQILARDFGAGVFKGGDEPEQLYRRVRRGLPGTPMTENDLPPAEIWSLVRHVRSLATAQGAGERYLQGRAALTVKRTASALPESEAAPAWSAAPAVDLTLRPLWWRDNPPQAVTARALHDGKEIAVRLEWPDPTEDADNLKTEMFTDGAAVQLSAEAAPPFFGMGEPGRPVNLWHWKACWEQDRIAGGPRDVAVVYPAMHVDQYPNPRGPGGTGAPVGYLTGRDAQNPVSAASHPSAVEDLNARQFGTLTTQPVKAQNVRGVGAFQGGKWRVLFRRALSGADPGDVSLAAGSEANVAFAVWDGGAGDRDGRKCYTVWHALKIER